MNARQRRKLFAGTGLITMLIGGFMTVAPTVAGASPNAADYGFSVTRTFDDGGNADPSDDTTTFTYTVTGPVAESISHAVFGAFCATPVGYTGRDFSSPQQPTGAVGWKWDVIDSEQTVGDSISFTFAGDVAESPTGATITIKKQDHETQPYPGPQCESEPPCTDSPNVPGNECTPDACAELEGDQEPGTDCTPDCVDSPNVPGNECTPDACPDVEGDQEPGAECPSVLPSEETPKPAETPKPTETPKPAEAPKAANEVKGVQVTRQLPRTGSEATDLAGYGAGLLLLGAGLVITSRARRFGIDA